jgi:AcrR family transcriptional regulator
MWIPEEIGSNDKQAAAELLMARGYEGVSAEELARAYRVSVGSLYRVYGDKRGLVRELRTHAQRALELRAWRTWSYASANTSDFGSAFLTFWCELARCALGQPGLFGLACLLLPPQEDPLPPLCATRQLLLEVLEAGMRTGAVRAAPAPIHLLVAWGALTEFARAARLRAEPPSEEELVALGQAVWAGLCDAAQAPP